MDNTKAIALLRRMQEPEAYEPQITAEAFVALGMAIEALRQADHIAEVSKMDCISRQAAIDALNGQIAVTGDINAKAVQNYIRMVNQRLHDLPSAQPEIIFCKDCVKHNKARGVYYDGTVIGIMDCCPLAEIRGRAAGHEFDYQYCAYAERKQNE